MCLDPVSLGVAQFAIGAASSVASFAAAGQEAKQTQEAAIEANAIQQRQLSRRQAQEQAALAQQKRQQNIEEAQKVSEVKVAGAARGVTGLSVDNLVADIHRQAANNRVTLEANNRMVIQQLKEEKKGSVATATARINSAPKPSAFSLVAGIGGAALNGVNTYNRFMD